MGDTKDPYPWHPDDDGVVSDPGIADVHQVTVPWSVRLVNDASKSFIDVNAYGEQLIPDPENPEDTRDPEYAVTVQLEWEELDGDGEEVAADISYDEGLDVRAYDADDLASGILDRAARAAVERYAREAGSFFHWDGRDLHVGN